MTDLKPFENLSVSTQTVMAYINCTFNIKNIFEKIQIETIEETNLKKIKGEYGKIYQLKSAEAVRGVQSKKGHFRNQITAALFIDKIITIKIFPTGKFHLTGCKNLKQQQDSLVELMRHIKSINTEESPTYTMENDDPLNIILEIVMVNVDFNIGFDIDQKKLDQILQKNANDFYSIYDTAVNTSVNIKFDYPDPDEKIFQQIIFNNDSKKNKVVFSTVSECPKAKPKEKRTHTFLVFSSSKVIQSGRYYDLEMPKVYKIFNDFILKHRNEIELKLKNNVFDMSKLKGISIDSIKK